MYLQPEPDTCKTADDVIAKARDVLQWRETIGRPLLIRPCEPEPMRYVPFGEDRLRRLFPAPVEEVLPEPLTVRNIQKVAEKYFMVSHQDMVATRGKQIIVDRRQIAMWATRVLMPEVSSTIVAKFYNKDHSTVFHCYERIQYNVDAKSDVGLLASRFLTALKAEFGIKDETGAHTK